jgi:hypothetical protein
MNAISPWVATELPVSNRKTSLVDDITDIFQDMWEQDFQSFRSLASSTDKDDAVEGSVTIDKVLLANLIKRAAPEGSKVARATVGDISRVMHYAAKRFGLSRTEIAARKADYLALTAAESPVSVSV